MNKYLLSIRIKGQVVKTTIEAESTIHAKLLGEWHYGIGSVTASPIKLEEQSPKTPLTPQQARIKSLQTQKDNVSKQLKAERNRQKITKARQKIAKANSQIQSII
jgi:hypothetical protein